MVGQGALRECLLDPQVKSVLVIGRASCGVKHAKMREVILPDLSDLSSIDGLAKCDTCFFCIGISSVGLDEAAYAKITFDLPLAVAAALLKESPHMRFVHISGASADSTEKGKVMWARVKGAAENALLKMPFDRVYALRPAIIRPLHGIKSRTGLYSALYALMAPLFPLLRLTMPGKVTTTEEVGRAMIRLAAGGSPSRVLENDELSRIGREGSIAKQLAT